MPHGFSSGGPFLDQHRHAAIDRLRQFGIALRTKDRHRARVRIEQRNLLRRQRETPLLLLQIRHIQRKKDKLGGGGRAILAGQGEQGELVAAMDTREDRAAVLKVKEARPARPVP